MGNDIKGCGLTVLTEVRPEMEDCFGLACLRAGRESETDWWLAELILADLHYRCNVYADC